MTILVLLSDTHDFHEQVLVPPGDILIHAGDITGNGSINQLRDFDRWLARLPHPCKIIIAGNHDDCFEKYNAASRRVLRNCIYLADSFVEVLGLKIYGSPWQPYFNNWSFNLQRGEQIRAKWDLIPKDVDVLITHGPPRDILDFSLDDGPVGCEELAIAVKRVKPKLHVFGHVHEGYGRFRNGSTLFVNASICTADYHPLNAPVIVDFPGRGE